MEEATAPGRANPLQLSVIVPLYRGERHVRRALESVLGQTGLVFELLAIDDASPDSTAGIASEVLRGSPVARLVRNRQNLGISGTLNRGLAESSAPLVLVLHQDCELLSRTSLAEALAE